MNISFGDGDVLSLHLNGGFDAKTWGWKLLNYIDSKSYVNKESTCFINDFKTQVFLLLEHIEITEHNILLNTRWYDRRTSFFSIKNVYYFSDWK